MEKENTNLKEEVKELKEKLNDHINQKANGNFNDSKILKNENDKNTMLTLLSKKIKNTTLLYREQQEMEIEQKIFMKNVIIKDPH